MADKVEILFQVQKDVRALKAMQDNFNDLQKDVVKMDKAMGKAFNMAGNVAKFIGTLAIARKAWNVTTALISRGIDFTATKEQSQVAFETLLGSADEAKERIDELIEFAAKTPFRLPGIIDANRQLQVLTDGTLAGEKGLRLVGDAAAATGRDMSQVAFWIGRTYAGLKSGTPVGEATLRLIEMGLVSGETALELQRLAKEARSGGDAMEIIEDTFAKTSGAMEKQSRTLVGLKTTLSDTIDQMAAEFSKPIFNVFKDSIEGLLLALGALETQTDVATGKIADRVKETFSKVGDAISIDEAAAAINDTVSSLQTELAALNKEIDSVPTTITGSVGAYQLKGTSFEDLGEYERALAVAKSLGEQMRLLRVAYDTIVNGSSNAFAVKTREGLEKEIALEQKVLDRLKKAKEFLPQATAPSNLTRNLAEADKRIAQQEKKIADLAIQHAASSFNLDSTQLDENKTKKAKTDAEKATEKAQNEAESSYKRIQGDTAKINKNHKTALETFELQNGTLEDQKKILEDRLAASKAAQAEEKKSLTLKVPITDIKSRQTLDEREKEEKAIAAAKEVIATSEKSFKTEQLRIETAILKVQDKITAKSKVDLKDKFKVSVAVAELKLDEVKHQKDLLNVEGLSTNERAAMNELVEQEKRLIQDVINLRRQEVKEVTENSGDQVRIAALEKIIQELRQKEETVKGGPTDLEMQKEVGDSKIAGQDRFISDIQHQKELLQLNGLQSNEREKMIGLIDKESNAIKSIIALRLKELELVKLNSGDTGEIDKLNATIDQLKQRLQLNENSKSDVTPLSRGQESQLAFDERENPENTFESTKEAGLAAIMDFQTQAGTFTSQFYDEMMNIQNTLQGGVSESIEGLITKTMSWGDAMRNVGNAIGTTVVKSIADMAAQWITSQLTMFIMGKTLSKSSTALAMSTNAALAASAAPAATLTAIASYGGSVAAAGLIPPAMLANSAAAAGIAAAPIVAAETGGLIRGGEQFVRMNEKGEEFVINHDVTKSFGLDFWNGINDGRITPQNIRQSASSSAGGSGGGGSSPNVNVAVFSKIEDASSWLDSQDGEKKFIDTYQRLKDEMTEN